MDAEKSSDNDHKEKEDLDNEYIDRLDSKGTNMRIRRVYQNHDLRYYDPRLSSMIYSYAKINI